MNRRAESPGFDDAMVRWTYAKQDILAAVFTVVGVVAFYALIFCLT